MIQTKVGDLHLVVAARYGNAHLWRRDLTSGNRPIAAYLVLCRGVRGPGWDRQGGDTPPGDYKVAGVDDIPPADPEKDAYGPHFIAIQDLSGNETRAGRAGVGIHGGGTGLANAYNDPIQELLPTLGCVRMHNAQLADLVHRIRSMDDGNHAYVTIDWS